MVLLCYFVDIYVNLSEIFQVHLLLHSLNISDTRPSTMRKQLDPRIPALIANGVKANHRSFFVMVGDKGRDQVGREFTYLAIDGN
jgi:hypothetical protein